MSKRMRSLDKITDTETAQRIREMIEGKADPREVSEACDRWVRQCYHEPSRDAQVMEAANELLGFYGVEGWADPRTGYRDGVSFCNTGDTYALTLFLDHGRFLVSSFGNMVESGRIRGDE